MEEKCINTIRCLAADTVQNANAGHPGAPMGCAPMAHVLWSRVMNYAPSDPSWVNRDRFVLSNGHACALQYCMLHLTGYDLKMDDLKQFRQLHSRTPGHPENFLTPGVEVSTGPLGQGISNAVGLSIAEARLASEFNRDGFTVVDHHTFVICGDGCLQEGVASEACSLAGHLGLGKLIVLYDDNKITIDGPTDLSFSEDVLMRFEAYGWHTQRVADGNADYEGIHAAVEAAKAVDDKPSIIAVSTIIGFGSGKQGTAGVHGAPLGADDIAAVKAKFGFDPAVSFAVSDDVASFYRDAAAKRAGARAAWDAHFEAYRGAHPELAAEFERRFSGDLPAGWQDALPRFAPTDKALATRQSSEVVLNALAGAVPEIIGGSADLTPSNKTFVKGSVDFQRDARQGRYLRFGVREHGMAAISNGMAAHGGLLPYCATFLVFTGYCLGSIRLSALSHFRVLYVMTHDSVQLGEDGPTHQPIETLATLRAIPNMCVLRPADANEVSGAYRAALLDSNKRRPSVIALSRQSLPNLPGSSVEGVARGAYVVAEVGGDGAPEITFVATGSEVSLCVKAAEAMGRRARVVSMPSWELYEEQDDEYKRSVVPAGCPTLAVEAGCTQGWDRYAHATIGIDRFGLSAPGDAVYEEFGFTPESVAAKAARLLDHHAAKPLPSLYDRPQL